MTSNFLLQGIANPAQADPVGSFRQGQQRREGREFNELATAIFQNTPGAKVAGLMKLDPSRAAGFANALGIPLNANDRIKSAMGGVVMVDKMLQAGVDPNDVAAFMGEQAQLIEKGGGDTSFMQKGIQALSSGNETAILEQVDAFRALAESFSPTKGADQKQINVLRKNVTDVTKDLRKVDSAFRKIQKAGTKNTAAGDMSLIFSFMKILDPGSTVREGEFATAQNTTGISGQILNFYNRAREGTRLNNTQRQDFISQADALFSAEQESADLSIANILQQADQDQIDRQSILGKKRLSEFNERRALLEEPAIQAAPTAAPVDLTTLSLEELQALRAGASQP